MPGAAHWISPLGRAGKIPCLHEGLLGSAEQTWNPSELFPLAWNHLSSWVCRIFDGEPEPLRRKML
jgi:hypothetical protein